jgi:hypothetical protein
VRFAAARWTRAALAGERIEAKAALAALDTCALSDADAQVRAICRGEDAAPAASTSPLALHALPADAQTTAPHAKDSLLAVRMPSGMVLIGYSDRRGHLNAGLAAPGSVQIESPASAKLEAPLPTAASETAAEPAAAEPSTAGGK